MMRRAWLAALIFALAIQIGTSSYIPEDDKSFGCAHYCLNDSSVNVRANDYFAIFEIDKQGSNFFIGVCTKYLELDKCLNGCPDGQYKSYLTALFDALKDACSGKEYQVIEAIASFFRTTPFTFKCRHAFERDLWQKFLTDSYSNYEADCAKAPGVGKIGNECMLFNCYINETSSLIAKKPELSANGAEIWKKLIRGMIQPALTRRFDYCYIPEEMVPKACKEIMSNGEGRSKVSVLSVVIAVIGLAMRCFSG